MRQLKSVLVSAVVMMVSQVSAQVYSREPASLQEGEVLRLNLHQEFRGQNSIQLKDLIDDQYPQFRSRGLEVSKVVVNAKSEAGRGEIALIRRGLQMVSQRVPMARTLGFASNRAESFNQIHYQIIEDMVLIPEQIQLALKGHIKISSVFVFMSATTITKSIRIPTVKGIFGGGQVLALKREIRDLLPQEELQKAELKDVKLLVKAKGQASLELVNAGVSQQTARLSRAHDFYSTHPSTFQEVILSSCLEGQVGAWVLKMSGEVNVLEIVVTYEIEKQRVRRQEEHPRLGQGERYEERFEERSADVIFIEEEETRLSRSGDVRETEELTRDSSGRVVRRRTTTTRRL